MFSLTDELNGKNTMIKYLEREVMEQKAKIKTLQCKLDSIEQLSVELLRNRLPERQIENLFQAL